MIKLPNFKIFLSDKPNKEELEKLSNKELFYICTRHQIGLKKVLIDFILTKSKI